MRKFSKKANPIKSKTKAIKARRDLPNAKKNVSPRHKKNSSQKKKTIEKKEKLLKKAAGIKGNFKNSKKSVKNVGKRKIRETLLRETSKKHIQKKGSSRKIDRSPEKAREKKETEQDTLKKVLAQTKTIDLAEPAEVVSEDLPIKDVLILLEKNSFVIVSKKYAVTGIITHLSILKSLQNKGFEKAIAKDFNDATYMIESDKPIQKALEEMSTRNTDILIVTNKGSLIGTICSKKILDHLSKKAIEQSFEGSDIIETSIDLFVELLRKGPIPVKEVQEKFGVTNEQIEGWIDILEKQNI
ncbi:MAG: hypothetical protein JW727_04385, partial [Candidatus Aenigmarchaeota archaeon]|nr:hypothetical protein [Candidatus Aenigmarchaeota archaeon]